MTKKISNRITKKWISEDEKRDGCIELQNGIDIIKYEPEQIPMIHPYSLPLTGNIVKKMSLEQQMAFTLEQICYLPEETLSYFRKEFYEAKLEELKDNTDAVDVTRYIKGSRDKVTVKKVPRDVIMIARSRNKKHEDDNQRIRKHRSDEAEKTMEESGKIFGQELCDICSLSLQNVKKMFGDCAIDYQDEKRKSRTGLVMDYELVKQKIAECFVAADDADPDLMKSMDEYMVKEDGKWKVKKMIPLYDSSTLYQALGWVYVHVDLQKTKIIKEYVKEKGYYFDFGQVRDRGFRYTYAMIVDIASHFGYELNEEAFEY